MTVDAQIVFWQAVRFMLLVVRLNIWQICDSVL